MIFRSIIVTSFINIIRHIKRFQRNLQRFGIETPAHIYFLFSIPHPLPLLPTPISQTPFLHFFISLPTFLFYLIHLPYPSSLLRISIYGMGAAEAGPSGRPAPAKGGRSKGTRPKKKVRAATAAAGSAAISGAGASGGGITVAGSISGAGGTDKPGGAGAVEANADLVRMFPGSMDDYRQGCLRLEKVRHDKLYQSQKRLQYNVKSIEQTFEWEMRQAEEAFAAGCRALVDQYLLENLAKTQRLEESFYGLNHRPSEATIASRGTHDYSSYNGNGGGGRPHGMALRTRGGSGDEKGFGNIGISIGEGAENDASHNVMSEWPLETESDADDGPQRRRGGGRPGENQPRETRARQRRRRRAVGTALQEAQVVAAAVTITITIAATVTVTVSNSNSTVLYNVHRDSVLLSPSLPLPQQRTSIVDRFIYFCALRHRCSAR